MASDFLMGRSTSGASGCPTLFFLFLGERIINVKKIVLALLLGVLAVGTISTSVGCGGDQKPAGTKK